MGRRDRQRDNKWQVARGEVLIPRRESPQTAWEKSAGGGFVQRASAGPGTDSGTWMKTGADERACHRARRWSWRNAQTHSLKLDIERGSSGTNCNSRRVLCGVLDYLGGRRPADLTLPHGMCWREVPRRLNACVVGLPRQPVLSAVAHVACVEMWWCRCGERRSGSEASPHLDTTPPLSVTGPQQCNMLRSSQPGWGKPQYGHHHLVRGPRGGWAPTETSSLEMCHADCAVDVEMLPTGDHDAQ